MHALLPPATRHFFNKLLKNKGSEFSQPQHGTYYKRHVHCCSTTCSLSLYALLNRSYAPLKLWCSFCRILYFNTILRDHRRICGLSLTEKSLCIPYLYIHISLEKFPLHPTPQKISKTVTPVDSKQLNSGKVSELQTCS